MSDSAITTGELARRYAEAVAQAGFAADPAQLATVTSLERLREALAHAERISLAARLMRRFSGAPGRGHAVRGAYLHGRVGRGKTWLMDLFFDSLPFAAKQRLHFHRFMQNVHAGLRAHALQSEPLAAVATDLAADARVLCLDELFVSDIADAMLLGGLFGHLIDRGVTLVFTSNVRPQELYRDGLQRQRFLPAIDLIERHCEVIDVDGAADHRLRRLTRAPIYLDAADPASAPRLQTWFEELADGQRLERREVRVEDRAIPVRAVSDKAVWFDFASLCEGPRSQNDYVSIAREFRSVLLSDVPIFDEQSDNAARRFIALVDELYDRRVHLILSAAAAPQALYRGTRLKFEFERTASRLIEMQSAEYLASERRA